ncbi:hypothetical protein [Gilliamella sp. Nev3-1]|uniref:hypothetical protein n=1 Tax=Gilliamella sp. Nev3-1 TaxID=3120250 RepID=UPI00114643F6|nr:hypothetical protein [Gilliamella apicola]
MKKNQGSNFESILTAKENKANTLKFLHKKSLPYSKIRYKLLNKLKSCYPTEPCCSPSCHICKREIRLSILTYLKDYFSNSNYLMVTIIDYNYLIDDDLKYFNLKKYQNNFYHRIRNIGINSQIIGCFELDYHQDINAWLPHFHLIIPDNTETIEYLRTVARNINKHSIRNGVRKRPILVQKLSNPIKQISYLFKFMPQMVISYVYKGKRYTRKISLKGEQKVIALVKFDRFGFNNLIFKYGIRLPNFTKNLNRKS